MSEGISPNQITEGVQTITKVIPHADIMTLASTPYVILPATSGVLNYSGHPTELFIPVFIHCVLNTLGGGYTNNAAATNMQLKAVWGSDASTDISDKTQVLSTLLTTQKVSYLPLSLPWAYQVADPAPEIESLPILLTGNLYDNAVAIYGLNGGAGVMTGGHADNYLQVTVDYKVIEIT